MISPGRPDGGAASAGARRQLNAGLDTLCRGGLPAVDAARREALAAYAALTLAWNRRFNLVRCDSAETFVTRHVLDAAAAAPLLGPGALLDIGSGAGIPGIVVALLEPERPVTVLDSSLKRSRFLMQAKITLSIDNLTVERARVETLALDRAPEVITARAFGTLAALVEATRSVRGPHTLIQALKAELPPDELAGIDRRVWAIACADYAIPGFPARRQVVTLSPLAPPREM